MAVTGRAIRSLAVLTAAGLDCVYAAIRSRSDRNRRWITTGGHIPEVVITALNVNTGISAIQRSNESGVYTFLTLAPGEYRFTAEKPGFRKRVIEGALLRVGDHFDQNILLEVGAVSESVEISGAGDAITYLTPTTSTLLTAPRIAALPTFGRNVMDFVTLAPGLISTMNGVNVNGSRTDAVNVTLDGINILDNFINESIQELQISLSTDRIEELRVVTSPVDAEFGRGAAQVLAASRAGTNRFHGAAYNYLRNDALNANGWTNNRTGIQRPIVRENSPAAVSTGRSSAIRPSFSASSNPTSHALSAPPPRPS